MQFHHRMLNEPAGKVVHMLENTGVRVVRLLGVRRSDSIAPIDRKRNEPAHRSDKIVAERVLLPLGVLHTPMDIAKR